MHPAVEQSLLVSRPTPLKKFLAYSAGAHVGVVLVGLILSAIFGKPMVDLDQKPIQAKLVRLGKPRDEKLLPRKEELPPPPQEAKAVEAPPAPTEAPPPTPAAVPISVPNAPKAQKVEKQDGVRESENRRKSLFSAFDKASKSHPEELEGQEDGDPMGDAAKAEGERYWGILSSQVRRHYDVSQTIPDQERIRLKARVVLKIGRTGEVIAAKLSRPSGNDLFDSAVLSAVKKASPFSPPPEALRSVLQGDGVEMEFTP